MKSLDVILIMLYASLLLSCSSDKKKVEREKCLPGIVLIGYQGEVDKPVYPLVIRTDAKDSTYQEFIGFENAKFQKTGFISSTEYFRISTVEPKVYHILKTYIIMHNTHKVRSIFNANVNTLKIILIDQCDSLAYTVDKEDQCYFLKMNDTIDIKENSELKDYLWYYHEILEWVGSRN